MSINEYKPPAANIVDPGPIRLVASSILRGANIYHRATVVRQEVDFGSLKGRRSCEAGADFAPRFLQRFFDPRRTLPTARENQSFVDRLHSAAGAPFEEVLLEAMLYVESLMAFTMYDFNSVGMARVLATQEPSHALLVWESNAPSISRGSAKVGLVGVGELLPASLYAFPRDSTEHFASMLAALELKAKRRQISTTTSVIMLAAKQRGIPCESVKGPHLRLGNGAAQRMIYASVPGETTLAAAQLCRNKRKANLYLAQLGLPVTEQVRVGTSAAAIAAADTLSYPVVVKPLKGKQGLGVTVGIQEPAEIPAAFDRAHASGSDVLVERFVSGATYRLLIIGGKFIAALKIVAPTVRGDGQKSISELITQLNDDPMRNSVRLFSVDADAELIAHLNRCGYELEDVLEEGTEIPLRSAANVAIGGIHSDVTDIVHPDNQAIAVRAATSMQLSVAGVDFMTTDIGRSYKEVGGCIIEMNSRPGFCMHTFPRFGTPRDVSAAFLDLSFAGGDSGRIPTAVVVGDRKSGAIARNLDAILRAAGKTTALVTKSAAFVDGEQESAKSSGRVKTVRRMLRDPRVDTYVAAVSPQRAVTRGLMLDFVSAAAVLRPTVAGDMQNYRQALALINVVARNALVVDADNESALGVIGRRDPRRLILVSARAHPAIEDHLAAGGCVVVATTHQDRFCIVIRRQRELVGAVPLLGKNGEEISNWRKGELESRLFAVALAFSLGVSPDQIGATNRSTNKQITAPFAA